jgi:integrase
LGSPAFPGTYVKWREELNALLDKAGVKMTPYGFRHFRISEWWLRALQPTGVSKMVGTSERKSEKRTSTGSRKQKIVWMRFSANHGSSRVSTRTAMRRKS